jgi:hypothetical protein
MTTALTVVRPQLLVQGFAVKRVGVFALVLLAAALAPGTARAGHQCGIPDRGTLWIDFGDGSVPHWELFAQSGNIVGAAGFIYPPRIRALGAKTVYFDLNFRHRIGTPAQPENPALVEERAQRLYSYASASMQCPRPIVALNELFGASTATPWSASNAQYRANVLIFMRTLAARGARPVLLISSEPYTDGEAADWWREAARYGDLVREVYFPAPSIHRRGVVLGNRMLRSRFRSAATELLAIGIPAAKIGLMLGFQTTHGRGGRDRLQPARAWFEVVKWQALSARQVSRELGLGSVWSWGWGVWSDGERDPDKPAAACVWLWARNPRLCNGPRAAGKGFDASRTEGQINVPRSVHCTFGERKLTAFAVAGLARITGDRQVALTALFARLAAEEHAPVTAAEIREAERAIVAARFGWRFAAYRSMLARAGASVAVGRGIIGDELRRAKLKKRFRVGYPSGDDVAGYYEAYGTILAREITANPAPWWLNGRKRGIALASNAPPQLFRLPAGRTARVSTLSARFRVRPIGVARPLSAFPRARVRPAIVAALRDLAREAKYGGWSIRTQNRAHRSLTCARDELPQVDDVDLASYVPFLQLTA